MIFLCVDEEKSNGKEEMGRWFSTKSQEDEFAVPITEKKSTSMEAKKKEGLNPKLQLSVPRSDDVSFAKFL